MKVPYRSGRIRWDYVGWLLALVGGLMSLFGQPTEANAAAPDQSRIEGYPLVTSAQVQ